MERFLAVTTGIGTNIKKDKDTDGKCNCLRCQYHDTGGDHSLTEKREKEARERLRKIEKKYGSHETDCC